AHAAQTLALLERVLAGKEFARLVNTHCHSDHMGGNAAIQKKYGCRTSIPEGEAPLIDRWDEQALILAIADQRAERFRYDDTFRDGDRSPVVPAHPQRSEEHTSELQSRS